MNDVPSSPRHFYGDIVYETPIKRSGKHEWKCVVYKSRFNNRGNVTLFWRPVGVNWWLNESDWFGDKPWNKNIPKSIEEHFNSDTYHYAIRGACAYIEAYSSGPKI